MPPLRDSCMRPKRHFGDRVGGGLGCPGDSVPPSYGAASPSFFAKAATKIST